MTKRELLSRLSQLDDNQLDGMLVVAVSLPDDQIWSWGVDVPEDFAGCQYEPFLIIDLSREEKI